MEIQKFEVDSNLIVDYQVLISIPGIRYLVPINRTW